jgi:hypothetical protein
MIYTADNATKKLVTYFHDFDYYFDGNLVNVTSVNISWNDDFICCSYDGILPYDVAVKMAVAEFNQEPEAVAYRRAIEWMQA